MTDQFSETNYQLLKTIINHATSCVAAKDLNGRYLFVNGQYERLFNTPEKDFIGRMDADNFPAKTADKFREADLEVINKKKVILIEEPVPIDGEIRYFLSSKFPIFDTNNQLIATGVIATDITERKQMEMELKKLAETDPLTEIINRRKIFNIAEKELIKSIRYNLPFSLIMLDIDHFKKTNDQMGHLYGDQVLKSVAEICRSTIRDVDDVGRIGGDEFLITLPNTNASGALQLAQKLVSKIAQDELLNSNQELPVNTTVCSGVAELTQCNNNMAAIVNAADKALYKAKKFGRNRACLY